MIWRIPVCKSRFPEISEVLRVLQALQESVNVSQVRVPGLALLDPAGKDVRDGIFSVKVPAKLLVNPSEDLDLSRSPCILEILKILQLQRTNPLVKVSRMSKILLQISTSFFIIKDVMILSITIVSEDILRILASWAIQFLKDELSQIQLIYQLVLSVLNFEMGLPGWFLLILFVLRLEGILRMREHILRNRQPIFYGVPRHQSQWIVIFQVQRLLISDATLIRRGFVILLLLEYFEDINNFWHLVRHCFSLIFNSIIIYNFTVIQIAPWTKK